MKFSYRHPDVTAKEAERAKLIEKEPEVLIERRQTVREIPTPAATEGEDEDLWYLWDKAEHDRKAK